MIIAIDGPAASGKGTLARRIARHYGFVHLDTGALYRAVAARVLWDGGDPADRDTAMRAARSIDPAMLDDPGLRTDQVGQAASVVAAMPEVRAALLAFQRDVAATPLRGHWFGREADRNQPARGCSPEPGLRSQARPASASTRRPAEAGSLTSCTVIVSRAMPATVECYHCRRLRPSMKHARRPVSPNSIVSSVGGWCMVRWC